MLEPKTCSKPQIIFVCLASWPRINFDGIEAAFKEVQGSMEKELQRVTGDGGLSVEIFPNPGPLPSSKTCPSTFQRPPILIISCGDESKSYHALRSAAEDFLTGSLVAGMSIEGSYLLLVFENGAIPKLILAGGGRPNPPAQGGEEEK